MKNRKINFIKLGILLFGICLLLFNCENEEYVIDEENLLLITISQKEAISILNNHNKKQYKSKNKNELKIEVDWKDFKQDTLSFTDALLSNVEAKLNVDIIYKSRLIFINVNNKTITAIETQNIENVDNNGNIQNGKVYYHKFDGAFLIGYQVINGETAKRLLPKKDINTANFLSFFSLNDDCNEQLNPNGIFCDQELDGFTINATKSTPPKSSPLYYYILDHPTLEEDSYVDETRVGGGGSGGDENQDNTCSGGKVYNSVSGNCECGQGYTEINGLCVEEDQIINNLTGKEKCVYEKLKELKLFKSTIGKFGNNKKYNLILNSWKSGACNSKHDDGCTDASDLINGNVNIYIQNIGFGTLDVAQLILHEGIHAEIYKYVDEYKKGLDPNARKELLDYYFKYKAQNDNTLLTSNAQHQYMADNYVKPIAEALRQLDNYKYQLNDYMGLAWNGLRRYGWDGYNDNGKWITLDTKVYEGTITKVLNNTDFNKNCN